MIQEKRLVILVGLLLVLPSAVPSESSNVSDIEDYDGDYELLPTDDNGAKVIRDDESPLSRSDDPVEMSTSQCSNRDRTRVCDCGYVNQVRLQEANVIYMTHPPPTKKTITYFNRNAH